MCYKQLIPFWTTNILFGYVLGSKQTQRNSIQFSTQKKIGNLSILALFRILWNLDYSSIRKTMLKSIWIFSWIFHKANLSPKYKHTSHYGQDWSCQQSPSMQSIVKRECPVLFSLLLNIFSVDFERILIL